MATNCRIWSTLFLKRKGRLTTKISRCGIPNRKVPLGRCWVKTKTCFSVKIPVEWDINQPSRWNLCWDTAWRSYMLQKCNFEKQRCQVGKTKKNRGKIGFAFFMLAEWWKWKMLYHLTMRYCVWRRPGTMWWCRGVQCTKNYSLPSGNEKYYITAPQHETLCSRMLCWFTYFMASRVYRWLVFLPFIRYRVNVKVECTTDTRTAKYW